MGINTKPETAVIVINLDGVPNPVQMEQIRDQINKVLQHNYQRGTISVANTIPIPE